MISSTHPRIRRLSILPITFTNGQPITMALLPIFWIPLDIQHTKNVATSMSLTSSTLLLLQTLLDFLRKSSSPSFESWTNKFGSGALRHTLCGQSGELSKREKTWRLVSRSQSLIISSTLRAEWRGSAENSKRSACKNTQFSFVPLFLSHHIPPISFIFFDISSFVWQ